MSSKTYAMQTDTLASYLPPSVIQRFLRQDHPLREPHSERLEAAVLFADISGFTALTERLTRRGPQGVEEISRLLNSYFSRLIDLVIGHGGEVFKFAGDALLALWPVCQNEKASSAKNDSNSLPESLLQAAHCALAIQNFLKENASMHGAKAEVRVRIGLSAGEMLNLQVGGLNQHWEFVITGEPLKQVANTEAQAQPGEIVIDAINWQHISKFCQGEELPSGDVSLKVIIPSSSPCPSPPLYLPARLEKDLQNCVPEAILPRLTAGQTDWLAELRRLTVLFINLPGINIHTRLEEAQTITRTLQEIMSRYQGSVDKLSIDDKGITLLAALGLPPMAHEDDPVRGVLAALSARQALNALGVQNAIGVTTGRAFCGTIGNANRREYTMIGAVVNMSARLMSAASGSILCDTATFRASRYQIEFEPLQPIQVKGRGEPVPVYQPISAFDLTESLTGRPVIGRPALVGRAPELAFLTKAIDNLRSMQSGVIIIEGEAGIGKSLLVAEILTQATSPLIRLVGAGNAIETATPYHAWRPVFNQIFQLEDLPESFTDDERRAQIERQIESLSPPHEITERLALLNPVLPIDLNFPESPVTQAMSGQVRADNTRDVLLLLLYKFAQRNPIVLALEDAQWLDSASWGLANAAGRSVHPLLLLIVTRPMIEPLPVRYAQLRRAVNTQIVRVGALSTEESLQIVCQRLGVNSLDAAITGLITEKAEGHPLFAEELAYTLRDSDLVQIYDGEGYVVSGIDLHALDFPDTVQGIVTSRIDRLQPQAQLTLKVASVIGRVFSLRTLRSIYPIKDDQPRLADYIQLLEKFDLVHLHTPDPEIAYTFKHVLVQEVAYNLMAYAQRRELHHALAKWYEQEKEQIEGTIGLYPLLAHHWHQAGEINLALDYLEKAGRNAFREGAYADAAQFFERAMRIDDEQILQSGLQAGIDSQRRADWERLYNEAIDVASYSVY